MAGAVKTWRVLLSCSTPRTPRPDRAAGASEDGSEPRAPSSAKATHKGPRAKASPRRESCNPPPTARRGSLSPPASPPTARRGSLSPPHSPGGAGRGSHSPPMARRGSLSPPHSPGAAGSGSHSPPTARRASLDAAPDAPEGEGGPTAPRIYSEDAECFQSPRIQMEGGMMPRAASAAVVAVARRNEGGRVWDCSVHWLGGGEVRNFSQSRNFPQFPAIFPQFPAIFPQLLVPLACLLVPCMSPVQKKCCALRLRDV